MTAPNNTETRLALANTDGLGSVEVNARDFAHFDEAMTLQVMQLIQQWKHVAAPNSQRRSQPKQPSK